MDEDALAASIRKFLRTVGVRSQREIEQAVREAVDTGKLSSGARLPVTMTLDLPALGLKATFEGEIEPG